MERMSLKERKQLQDLQAKYKRVQRAEEQFYKDADEMKEQLIERWNLTDRLTQAAVIIGTDPDELYSWITSDAQIAYYRRTHQISREEQPQEEPLTFS